MSTLFRVAPENVGGRGYTMRRMSTGRYEAFGARLKALRGKKSQQAVLNALAKRGIKITKGTLSKIEHGRAPSAVVLAGLAELYLEPRLVDELRQSKPTGGQAGQEIGQSKQHTSTQTGVNSVGTSRAKRSEFTRATSDAVVVAAPAETSTLTPAELAARPAAELAGRLVKAVSELQKLAAAVLAAASINPKTSSARPSRAAGASNLRDSGGSGARGVRRKAG